ncbi:DUF6671 family protein [Polynucleobacter sp. UK-Gri1-W3]|uniref:DUF6671 family protein n=1 Tax=Polynucleobacter sp. UK-Gri1-W3 TaxID=1819737 RepID=UPI001C0AF253|nr:DUF6671 family protein [Polynucleobacter sp. UK-Gri1-W3]MBU3538627.1 hypothetical protein [Polynucleobacter sp. UK-Gri1-W3]
MSIFSNRSVSLLTKHGKEKVIADVLNTQVGCLVQQTDAYDTDLLGTFTQETPRYGSQLDAVRKKAAIGMDLLKLDLGIANEGAFVNDPHSGMIPWNNELLLLVDQKHQLEITGFSSAPAQNNNTCLSHWEELEKFADNALFPSHYLVIKPTDEYHPQSKKGIKDLAELKVAFEWAKGLSSKGVIYVENDLRAFANPTRMENIRKAAIDLANKMNSPCPQCQTPGFWIKDVKRGLPCNACGLATDQEIAKVWGCLKCDHELTEGMKMFKLADPSKCHHCNP